MKEKPLFTKKDRYEVSYSGNEINKQKWIFDNETQEYQLYNAVYLPAIPKSRRVPANKYFGKAFMRNDQYLIKTFTGKKGLSGYDLGVLNVIKAYITWENNIIFDTDSKSYITAKDISEMTGMDEKTVSLSLKRLAALGIIFFIRGNRNERLILLNPYIAYMGEKMDKWIFDIINNPSLPFQPVAKVVFEIV